MDPFPQRLPHALQARWLSGKLFDLLDREISTLRFAGASDAPITPLIMASFSPPGPSSSIVRRVIQRKLVGPLAEIEVELCYPKAPPVLSSKTLIECWRADVKFTLKCLDMAKSFDSYHTHQPLPSAEYCLELSPML